MENYLMSSPTQLSHAFLPSDNAKPNAEEAHGYGFNGRPEDTHESADAIAAGPTLGGPHNSLGPAPTSDLANPHVKSVLDGRLSPSVYEDLDFASDLPDFSYDQTISLDLDEERLAPHPMIGRNGHAKTFSFDAGALQTPFTLNSGSKFSSFSHSRNVSLDDSSYSRGDSAGHYTGYSSGHSHSVSLASNSADPPSGTFSHSMSNSTLQSVDSVPQLSSSMSNKSLQESPYSIVNVTASTPGRRRLSTSLSASNLYATPLRGSSMHSPTVKVGKTPLKAHHSRSRSKPHISIEAGSSQLLASIANMKNLSAPGMGSTSNMNLNPNMNMNPAPSINLSTTGMNSSMGLNMNLGAVQTAPNSAGASKPPMPAYTVPHSAPINNDSANPFESSFVSPKVDMNLSDLDATPLATPAKSFSGSLQNFTPIRHNLSFGGSLNETNLSRLSRNDMGRMEPHLDTEYDHKDRKPVDAIKFEEQDDDACKQLKRAKSFVAVPDSSRAPLSRATSMRSLKSTPYTQSASIDLLSPDIMAQERPEFRSSLKSYPASIDLAAITKSPYKNPGYSHSYSNYSPEREYDSHDAKDRLLPPAPTARGRGRKSSMSTPHAYPTQSQIHETSTTEEIAKFAEKIMNSDSKRPIIVQDDNDEEPDPKKKHKCPLCLARFQRPEHVKRHLKCHSSEKPFQCDIDDCGRRFNRKDNLKAHLKKIHGKVL